MSRNNIYLDCFCVFLFGPLVDSSWSGSGPPRKPAMRERWQLDPGADLSAGEDESAVPRARAGSQIGKGGISWPSIPRPPSGFPR